MYVITYACLHVCVCVCSFRRAHTCYCRGAVCTSIQVAGLGSLRANQVECLNQDPAMHVDNLLRANEAGYDGGGGERQPIGRDKWNKYWVIE